MKQKVKPSILCLPLNLIFKSSMLVTLNRQWSWPINVLTETQAQNINLHFLVTSTFISKLLMLCCGAPTIYCIELSTLWFC